MPRPSIAALVSLVALIAAAPLQAQSSTFLTSGSTYEHLAVLRHQSITAASPTLTSSAVVSSRSRRTGTLLMIVGVAGIVTGLVVDEPVVTIAGAVVGGIGLYMYLDNSRTVRVGIRRALPSFSS